MTDNAKAIIWAVIASALYTVVITMAKSVIDVYHVLQILFFRQLVVFLTCIPGITKSFPEGLKTRRPGLHMIRLLGAFAALACGVWAVAVLPLTTAVTLSFAQSFFVLILAALFLKEVVGKHRIAAVILGFIGVLVVMRPGIDGFIDTNTLIPLLGALGSAIAIASVRTLSQTESTSTLLIYQSVFVGLVSGIPLFWLWVTPDFSDLIFLLLMGVVAAMGQWVGVKALRLGEASILGNIQYTQLFFAALFGYFIFNEIPDVFTLAGAAIIVSSAIYIFYRARISKV